MPEYIEREALIEDINETVVFTVREGVHLPTSEMRGANKVIDRIKSAPTADVVEVVRCRECECLKFSDCYGECSKGYMGIVSPDDYCSRGKRRGN